MDIKKQITELNKKELLDLRNYIDDLVSGKEGCWAMTVKEFQQKLKDEKTASIRLINVLYFLCYDVEFVHEITRDLFFRRRNAGLITWAEFVRLRGY